MPTVFAHDLGHGDPGLSYSMLLAADAAGGLLAGVILEGRGLLPPRARTAIVLAMLWSVALSNFAMATNYWLALGLLFAAGFFELAFNAMAQTLVQIHAPVDMRGRVIGFFNMASLGFARFRRPLGRRSRQPDWGALAAGAGGDRHASDRWWIADPAVVPVYRAYESR